MCIDFPVPFSRQICAPKMYSQRNSRKAGRGGRGKAGRQSKGAFFTAGSDPYAPASRQQAQAASSSEPTYVHRMEESAHYHLDFCLPYPNKQGLCVKDYGKGPQRLAPEEINSWTTALNCEWKRRPEYAVSFAAASMMALRSTVESIPKGLNASFPEEDKTGILKALLLARHVDCDSFLRIFCSTVVRCAQIPG